MNPTQRTYIAIDLKSFFASVECVERGLDPLTTNLVVADASRTEKTICLAVTPSLKAHGVGGRARLFEVVQRVREVNRQRWYRSFSHRLSGKSCDARARTVFPLLDISSSCQRPFPKLSSFTVTLLQNTPRSPTILRPTRSMASSSAFSSFLADTLSVSVSPNSVVTVTR